MNPVDLGKVLATIGLDVDDPDLLVGFDGGDDAAVYRVSEDLALIHTVDFFTPIVDDPYSFGQIAAANALSDVYAMGGEPLLALNIVCFPSSTLHLSILEEILRGGGDKVREAGAFIAGGHTIEDREPKYGLAVIGTVKVKDLLTNAGAEVGDDLILTKPIGGGIVTTGIKRGCVGRETLERVVEVMSTLNALPSKLMGQFHAKACTDITGFGLLGHAYEMAEASGVALKIHTHSVPLLPETRRLLREGILPGGSKANLTYLEDLLHFSPSTTEEDGYILCDAMTSGGLLISISKERSREFLARLSEERDLEASLIGEVIEGERGRIYVD